MDSIEEKAAAPIPPKEIPTANIEATRARKQVLAAPLVPTSAAVVHRRIRAVSIDVVAHIARVGLDYETAAGDVAFAVTASWTQGRFRMESDTYTELFPLKVFTRDGAFDDLIARVGAAALFDALEDAVAEYEAEADKTLG